MCVRYGDPIPVSIPWEGSVVVSLSVPHLSPPLVASIGRPRWGSNQRGSSLFPTRSIPLKEKVLNSLFLFLHGVEERHRRDLVSEPVINELNHIRVDGDVADVTCGVYDKLGM